MSSKKITFSVPDYIYNHLREFLDSHDLEKINVEDLFKACALNRMIFKGYLDEFGQPNPLCILPKLNSSIFDLDHTVTFNDYPDIKRPEEYKYKPKK